MNRRLTTTAAVACLFFGAAQAQAQDDDDEIYAPDESVASERCISLSRLRNTEVVNERNILFHMRGNKTYRNVLPRRCPSLRDNRSFSYRANMNRLCDNDLVTVLMDGGVGQMRGPSCGLGKFYLISEVEADALRNEAEKVEELGLEEPQ